MKNQNNKDYKLMAIVLENHIANYHPPGWREGSTIKSVLPTIRITPENARVFSEAYNAGDLEPVIANTDNRFKEYWVLREAVKSFFNSSA